MKSSANSLIANTYAKAIYNRAIHCHNWDAWERFLQIAAQIAHHPKFSKILDQPGTRVAIQAQWFIQLCDHVLFEEGKFLLQLLAKRKRLLLLPIIAQRFIHARLKYENTLPIEVGTAVVLTAEARQQLRARLVKKLQTKVILNEHVHSNYLGGIFLRVGNHVIDATIRARLNQLRARLSSSTGY